MTNKGVISFKFTDIISDSVEIGDFVWKVDRQRCTTTIYERCDGITCKPKDESPTVLWNCLVVGTLATVNKKHGVQRGYHWWSHLYGNNLTICDVHHKKERVSKALVAVGELGGKDVSGEAWKSLTRSSLTFRIRRMRF
ncbi:hypothetical protein L596_013198 [Steinernema carpocapsae]|uniref:Uncharacterized protein n=1 Tax=Steinernema carpocapsae TaxID=34508 RepID=A0A4U5NZG9_STECR|nr:hypothetical protein L596_013198 [Steinernema carpocapsae]